MPGAVLLAGEGALRAGAGRVSIATDPTHAGDIVRDRPELMVHGVATPTDLRALLDKVDVVAVGPGLGRSDWAAELLALLQADNRPAVWDADALNWLASSPNVTTSRVITPHPGEAATLLGSATAAVQSDRRAALKALQRKYGGIAVLKGAGSLVSGADEVPWLSTAGNPGMAAPGMGDVLTGMIAGLLAQGLSLQDAAVAAVDLHARAGDRAAAGGERGLIASDLLAEVRALVNA
jgi:NAD(P)H-hydrate epimerase